MPETTARFPSEAPAQASQPPQASTPGPIGVQPGVPPTDSVAPASDEGEHRSKDDEGKGLLGPFRIGVLVGTGLPSLLSFGGLIKVTRYFGAGLNVGLIPKVRISFYGDAKLSYQHYEIYGRLFPFGGSLFLGAGVGYATMNGTVANSYDITAFQSVAPGLPNPLSVDSEGSVKTLVLTPALGLLHTFASGFTLGVDLAAQIPIAPSAVHFKTNVPASVPAQLIDQYVTPNDKKVQDTLDKVGRTILPALSLRLGWLI
jgi:hypothetical protein